MTEPAPSPFSAHNPRLQIAWDSTSFGALMFCPTYYKRTIIEGWRSSGVHVEFGGYFASAAEVFSKARLKGMSKEEATIEALRYVIEATAPMVEDPDGEYGDVTFQPWGGSYETQWHCLGETKYKNPKGNHAKCPYSHKGKWFFGHGPDTCGTCGSHTETQRRWVPTDKIKNRVTLVKLVGWYCLEQPEDMTDGLAPYQFPDGTPAVELSFKMPTPWKNKYGETIILAGHLDRIVKYGEDEMFIADNKTTMKPISAHYWRQYEPNIQVDLYDLAGHLLYPTLPLKGVAIEAAQTLVDGANFGTNIFRRSNEQREELLADLQWWLALAEKMAEEDHYPMNRKNCAMCSLNRVCSKPKAIRERILEADFVKRHWNPLEER